MSVIPTSAPNDAPAPVDAEQTAAPQATPEVSKEKDAFAEKLELLSKKERTIWRERQRVEQMAKQLEAEKAEYEKFKGLKAKAKTNPMDYLSEAGLSYDELTQFVLNGGKPTEKDELQSLRDEFNRLREEQANEKKQAQEQQTQAQKQAEAQAIESFKEEIGEFIKSNEATYELSAQRDAVDDILTTINDSFVISMNEWNNNGRVGQAPKLMSIKDAADIVEEFYEKEVLRLAETSKLKAKLGIGPKEDGQQSSAKQPSKTLTNNMASTAASVIPAKNDHDRMRRALEKLGG